VSVIDRVCHTHRTVYSDYPSSTIIIFIIIIISGVRLSPLSTAATTGLLYQPQMIDDDDCGAIGGM
jgi:hypothetical protein